MIVLVGDEEDDEDGFIRNCSRAVIEFKREDYSQDWK